MNTILSFFPFSRICLLSLVPNWWSSKSFYSTPSEPSLDCIRAKLTLSWLDIPSWVAFSSEHSCCSTLVPLQGGLLIKSLLTQGEFQSFLSTTPLVITLATPHKQPALNFDGTTSIFHDKLNHDYRSQRATRLARINTISIGGAHRDTIVRWDLVDLHTNHSLDTTLLTTAMNDVSRCIFWIHFWTKLSPFSFQVWTSADHLCIVWCRQLTVKLNRLLFELVHPGNGGGKRPPLLIEDPRSRQAIIENRLSSHVLLANPSQIIQPNKVGLNFHEQNDWISHDGQPKMVRLVVGKVLKPTNHLFPLVRGESIVVLMDCQPKHDTFSVFHNDSGFFR